MVDDLAAALPASSKSYSVAINEALVGYSDFGDGCPEHLTAAIKHSLLAGGKRLRPLLVLYGAQACGSNSSKAMPAACAVEMIHTYSLIHDDLPAMDDDDLRRGRPSCHVAFGEATAILAGDALLTRAFELLATEISSADVARRCCAELAKAAGATKLVGGQADDLHSTGNTDSLSNEDRLALLERIHARKTGALLVASLKLGAMVADATEQQLKSLTEYGRNLGLAFQITDDLLDLRGDEATLGKSIGKDTDQGKLTFPAVLGIESSRNRADSLIQNACACVDSFGNAGTDLQAIARFVLERDR
jgi:geranylgeranyl diphosphate synthase type II